MITTINNISIVNDRVKYDNTFRKNTDNAFAEMLSNENVSAKKEKLDVNRKNIKDNQLDNSRNKEENKNSQEDSPKVTYKKLAEKMESIAKIEGIYFEFVKDEETEEMLMRVIDKETNEIIRQYPSEITLKIAKIINKTLEVGQITDAKV
ncbi:MAG: flagellar protein FlaG [Ignavibacteria bacterium]|jgi:flagellar protein FlaG|nr:flagellar protein FlaG [Ignavibacteria bacterium]